MADEVPGQELPAVESCEHEAVDDEGPRIFLHEVEGERGLARSDAVQVADVRIQADVFEAPCTATRSMP